MLLNRYLFLLHLLVFLQITPGLARAFEGVPEFFQVNYTLYSNDTKIGLMKRKFFRNEEGNYTFRSVSKTTGFISIFRKDHIVEQSHWQFNDNGFMPLHYIYQHTGGKKDRDVEISFDWDRQKITNRVNESVWHMETEENILDKLLYQLAIMSSLKSGTVPESYTIADGGKIKKYLFEYIGEEEIDTPLGKLKTTKLKRHKPNNDRKTLLWFAHDLDYLPIKVVNEEKKGRLTTAIIDSLKGFGVNTHKED